MHLRAIAILKVNSSVQCVGHKSRCGGGHSFFYAVRKRTVTKHETLTDRERERGTKEKKEKKERVSQKTERSLSLLEEFRGQKEKRNGLFLSEPP